MAFHPQDRWHPLTGQEVIITRQGEVVGHGTVEAVTVDDQILWLAGEGAHPRRLYERSAGFEAWIDYKWETDGPRPDLFPSSVP
jgi:hypothetical protein